MTSQEILTFILNRDCADAPKQWAYRNHLWRENGNKRNPVDRVADGMVVDGLLTRDISGCSCHDRFRLTDKGYIQAQNPN